MKPAIVITSHVVDTLNSLPAEERVAVTSALAAEMILGEDIAKASLTPMQLMIYSMIRSYVNRDTARFINPEPASAPSHDPFQLAVSSAVV